MWLELRAMYADVPSPNPLIQALIEGDFLFRHDARFNGSYLHWSLVEVSAFQMGASSGHELYWAVAAIIQYGASLFSEEREKRQSLFASIRHSISVVPFLQFSMEIIRRESEKPQVVIYQHRNGLLREVYRTNQLKYGDPHAP